MLWIRVGGGCVRVGGTVRNTLKEGRRSKDFEKEGAREGLEPPYETMMFTSTL